MEISKIEVRYDYENKKPPTVPFADIPNGGLFRRISGEIPLIRTSYISCDEYNENNAVQIGCNGEVTRCSFGRAERVIPITNLRAVLTFEEIKR